MENQYFVVEAWEMREMDPTPHHVHTRLHYGTKEGIGRFWSAWNEKNFPAQRIDRVVAERESREAAMNDLRSHVAWRKRQKDLAGCTDKIPSVGCADSSPEGELTKGQERLAWAIPLRGAFMEAI